MPTIGESPLGYLHDAAPPIPAIRHDLHILQSLRRIIRAVDLFSKRLTKEHRITAPQLVCLHRLLAADGLTVKELSQAVFLSPSTIVGILDRLEQQGLVTRLRSATDRRKVILHVTQNGRDLVASAPSPLQQALQTGLLRLGAEAQSRILTSLDALVGILEMDRLDAAPLLESGPIDPGQLADSEGDDPS